MRPSGELRGGRQLPRSRGRPSALDRDPAAGRPESRRHSVRCSRDRRSGIARRRSCASAGICTAVGSYFGESGDVGGFPGLLVSETDGSWSAGLKAPLPPDASAANLQSVYLSAVSCASPAKSTAVGCNGSLPGRAADRDSRVLRGSPSASALECGLGASCRRHPGLGLVRLGRELQRRRELLGQLGRRRRPAPERDERELVSRRGGRLAVGRFDHKRLRRVPPRCHAPRLGTAPRSACTTQARPRTAWCRPETAGSWSGWDRSSGARKPRAGVRCRFRRFGFLSIRRRLQRGGHLLRHLGSPAGLVLLGGDPTAVKLEVSRRGTGSGTVSSQPAGIHCGSACSGSWGAGTALTLTPTAAPGSRFGRLDRWRLLACPSLRGEHGCRRPDGDCEVHPASEVRRASGEGQDAEGRRGGRQDARLQRREDRVRRLANGQERARDLAGDQNPACACNAGRRCTW